MGRYEPFERLAKAVLRECYRTFMRVCPTREKAMMIHNHKTAEILMEWVNRDLESTK